MHRLSGSLRTMARTFCLALILIMQNLPISSQTPQEASIRSFIERFFALYAAEDINAFMALWSAQSPYRQAFAANLTDLFGKIDLSFSNLRFLRFQQVDEGKVTLRVAADALVRQITSPTPTLQTITRTFVLVKEGNEWKIWRYYPTVQELAEALVSATDEAEVEKLLNAERELVNNELLSILISLAEQHSTPKEAQQMLRFAQLAKTIAACIDDPADYAYAYYLESDAFWLTGDLEQSIEVKEKCLEWLQAEVERSQANLPPEKFARLQAMLFQLLHWTGIFYQIILGDSQRVLQKAQTMLHYARRYGDTYMEATALNVSGGERIGMGEVVQGVQEIEQAVNLFERLLQQQPENKELANHYLVALNHLASAYVSLHIPQRALNLYGKSLRISQKLGNKVGEMGALWGIGLSFTTQSNWAKAKTYLEQSLKMAKEEEHIGWIFTNLGTLIELHRKQKTIMRHWLVQKKPFKSPETAEYLRGNWGH